MKRTTINSIILFFFLAFLNANVFGQLDWDFGDNRKAFIAVSSPPLAMKIPQGRIRGYVHRVGGVAFITTAVPDTALHNFQINYEYVAANPDGARLRIVIKQDTLYPFIPDWQLIPIARFANANENACVSLFGDNTSKDSFDIRYHEAFINTLLGVRLLQADLVPREPKHYSGLPKYGGKTIFGHGEEMNHSDNVTLDVENEIERILGQDFAGSWILTDDGVDIIFSLVGGKLSFTGSPYYFFWKTELSELEYQLNEITALLQQQQHKTANVIPQRLKDAEKGREETRDQIEEINNNKAQLEKQITSFSDDLTQQITNSINKLEEDEKSIRIDIDGIERNQIWLDSFITERNQEVKTLDSSIVELKQELQNMREIDHHRQILENEIVFRESKKRLMENYVMFYKEEGRHLENNLSQLKEDIAYIEERIKGVWEEKRIRQAQTELLNENKDIYESKTTLLGERERFFQDQIVQLKEQNNTAAIKMEQLEQEKNALEQRKKQLGGKEINEQDILESKITGELKNRYDLLMQYNEPVYSSTLNVMHYAAFFRHLKKTDPITWRTFHDRISSVHIKPMVKTPTTMPVRPE